MSNYDNMLADERAYIVHLQQHPDAMEHGQDTHSSRCFYLAGGDCTCATIDKVPAHLRALELEARGGNDGRQEL